MQNDQSAIALLLFRVGPVLCCAPANPVQSIIAPPKLTHPPGFNAAKPGIFYHADHVISVSELRHRFGVAESDWTQPGRLIITLQGESYIAYWVDEIIEVIDTPKEGWATPSSHLPHGVFSKTLLLNETIYLFSEFADFENLPESGYLSQFIGKLASGMTTAQLMVEADKTSPSTPEPTAKTASPTVLDDQAEGQPATEAVPITGQDVTANITDAAELPQKTEAEQHTTEPDPLYPQQDRPAAETSSIEMTAQPPVTETIVPPPADDHAPSEVTESTPALHEPLTTAAVMATASTDQARSEEEPAQSADVEPPTRMQTETVANAPDAGTAPFPLMKLAAAVILFMTIAGIGIYKSLPMTDRTPRPTTVLPDNKPQSEAMTSPSGQAAVPEQHNLKKTGRDAPASRQQTLADNTAPAQAKYRAEIKPDSEGVTILLHSPKNEKVLKPLQQANASAATSHNNKAESQNRRAAASKQGQEEIIHIVIKGDTLWAIAKHYVNNPYQYPQLARLSKISNPDRIYPGNRVRILRIDRNEK